MELQHQNQLDSIENCPLGNESGELILFRCVENPMTSNSFIPKALEKDRLKGNCLAWGLSVFDNLDSANEILKSLSQNKREKVSYECIASSKISDNDGIKHASYRKSHYTYYPKSNIDLMDKFSMVQDGK